MNDSQRWAEDRLVSYLLDALPETEAARVEEILGEVEEYQDILIGRTPEEVGHIPASLLARWHAAGLEFVGVERVLVLQHLGSCANCREELELVGGSLQSWVDAPESAPHEAMGQRPLQRTRIARSKSSSSWRAWLPGAAMGFAAGVLIMFALPEKDQSPDGLHGVALPVVVPQKFRGAKQDIVPLVRSDQPLLLALVVPKLDAPADAELVVRDADGIILSRTLLTLGPEADRTAQILLQPTAGWSAGSYSIQLVIPGQDKVEELGRFEIEIAP